MEFFGYDESDFIPSELSGRRANDIHHIDARGAGGDPTGSKDCIENLMALTRAEHELYGDKKQFIEQLRQKHFEFMKSKGVFFKSITDKV